MSNTGRANYITLRWPEYGLDNYPADLVGELRIGDWDYTLYSLKHEVGLLKPVVIMMERVSRVERTMVERADGRAFRFTLRSALRYLATLSTPDKGGR